MLPGALGLAVPGSDHPADFLLTREPHPSAQTPAPQHTHTRAHTVRTPRNSGLSLRAAALDLRDRPGRGAPRQAARRGLLIYARAAGRFPVIRR